jgi:hypothetical protein
MAAQKNDWKSYLTQLETTLAENFKKAPALPPNVKEAIVQYGPWITLILLVLSIGPILALLGVGALLGPIAMMGGYHFGVMYYLAIAFLVVGLVLEALAIPKLMKRQKSGWDLMFYSSLLNVVYSVLNFNIVGLIVGTLVGWYFLFQIREYYK